MLTITQTDLQAPAVQALYAAVPEAMTLTDPDAVTSLLLKHLVAAAGTADDVTAFVAEGVMQPWAAAMWPTLVPPRPQSHAAEERRYGRRHPAVVTVEERGGPDTVSRAALSALLVDEQEPERTTGEVAIIEPQPAELTLDAVAERFAAAPTGEIEQAAAALPKPNARKPRAATK